MNHYVKINRNYFDRIYDGVKTFEVRFNDRDYQVGDFLKFTIINIDGSSGSTVLSYKIVYVHSGLGMQDGFVILGIVKDGI